MSAKSGVVDKQRQTVEVGYTEEEEEGLCGFYSSRGSRSRDRKGLA